MICGAALYAESYPLMKETVLTWGDLGKLTIPAMLGINHWPIIILCGIGGITLFRFLEKKNL
jgi:hypothetical protein